jgi:heat shock protein 1/8
MLRLRNACEKVKIRLSYHDEGTVDIEELMPNTDFCMSITREKFEDLCKSVFTKILEPINKVLKEAKVAKSDVNEIVLVGGSTRIPKIKKLISELFNGKALNVSINPDEAVAFGATIQAAILNGEPDIPHEFVLLDVIPISLGIAVRDGSMDTIIHRNTKIPTQRSWVEPANVRSFDRIRVRVLEGERLLAEENNELAQIIVDTKKGQISNVHVTFEVDTSGILAVTVIDEFTKDLKAAEINKAPILLTTSEVLKLQKEAALHRKDDEKEIERIAMKNKLFTTCIDIQYLIRMNHENMELADRSKDKLIETCQDTESWLKSNQNAKISTFAQKKEELSKALSTLVKEGDVNIPTGKMFKINYQNK